MRASKALPSSVLSRKAVVYVRQSTSAQVRGNLESQRRQYHLEDVARQHGFGQVEIIDDDLGLSARAFFDLRESLEFSISWKCDSRCGLVKEASLHDTTSFE